MNALVIDVSNRDLHDVKEKPNFRTYTTSVFSQLAVYFETLYIVHISGYRHREKQKKMKIASLVDIFI